MYLTSMTLDFSKKGPSHEMTQCMDETIDGMTYCAIFFCTRKAMTQKKL